MNNDVIELENRLKTAAIVNIIDGDDEITISCDDLTKLCEAVEKLAEYEKMDPVAWGRHTGMNRTLDLTVLPERVTEWREFNEAHPDPDIADDIFPLYRHPNK
ncbi:hypothetical protein ABLB69_14680 [Xenorhabdus khoisanae]|uniref:hypothetical protein n=1 Tax=Xenorhabdus khoisanae TaxID=880157 RepID=UPI0032B72A48